MVFERFECKVCIAGKIEHFHSRLLPITLFLYHLCSQLFIQRSNHLMNLSNGDRFRVLRMEGLDDERGVEQLRTTATVGHVITIPYSTLLVRLLSSLSV